MSADEARKNAIELAFSRDLVDRDEVLADSREHALVLYFRESGTKSIDLGDGWEARYRRMAPHGPPARRRRQRELVAGGFAPVFPWEKIEFVAIVRRRSA